MTDPYFDWLGIPKGKRPPTHYELLGIAPAPDIAEHEIEWAMESQLQRLQPYLSGVGPNKPTALKIAKEIMAAHDTLIDSFAREYYNATCQERPASWYKGKGPQPAEDPDGESETPELVEDGEETKLPAKQKAKLPAGPKREDAPAKPKLKAPVQPKPVEAAPAKPKVKAPAEAPKQVKAAPEPTLPRTDQKVEQAASPPVQAPGGVPWWQEETAPPVPPASVANWWTDQQPSPAEPPPAKVAGTPPVKKTQPEQPSPPSPGAGTPGWKSEAPDKAPANAVKPVDPPRPPEVSKPAPEVRARPASAPPPAPPKVPAPSVSVPPPAPPSEESEILELPDTITLEPLPERPETTVKPRDHDDSDDEPGGYALAPDPDDRKKRRR